MSALLDDPVGIRERVVALPRLLTPLVGRDAEAAAVAATLRLDGVRLLTLTGPGGVGKTRLALRVAEDLTADFHDGVVFVALANVTDPSLVLPAIAQSVGVRESGDSRLGERLARGLAHTRLLLVLDNLEQVVSAGTVVAGLIAASPNVKALVTSRMPLRVAGEHEFAVPPLSLPTGAVASVEALLASPAVALFVQRTQAVRSEFVLDDANAAAVAEVCRRVDGLPLAIELAAARGKILSPSALLVRLSSSLGLLTGGARDQPARLQTLRAAIAWSYDLLTVEARRLFRHLAVFVGGCTLDSVEAVASDSVGRGMGVLDGVEALVDSSLLRREEAADGEPRFGMLVTIREYGLEQLAASGEEHDARARHAAWCLALAIEAEPALYGGSDQVRWLERLAAEHDNLRAALRWSIGHDSETGLRLAGAMFWFWYVRGHLREGREWLSELLAAAPAATDSSRARALLGAGMLAHRQGDVAAVAPLEEALSLSVALGDGFGTALALGLLALQAEDVGDYRRATDLMEEALALDGTAGGALPATLRFMAFGHLGIAAWGLGDIPRAEALLEQALAGNRASGDDWGAANVLGYLGLIACGQGRASEAAPLLRQCLVSFWRAGSLEDTAGALANVATLAGAIGSPERSARIFGAAQALRDEIDSRQGLPEREVFDRATDAARSALGAAAFPAAWAAGRALSTAEAVALALEVTDQAGAGPATDAAGGLTGREVEVLRLLVAGMTDREIGDALFISPRTAQAHVGHIFAKLGVSTRTAAVAVALRDGLVPDAPPPAQAIPG